MSFDPTQTGSVIPTTRPVLLEHLGPVIEVLTGADAPRSAPGLAQGTIRPGAFVPIHSHGDSETFFVLDGVLQALTYVADRPEWVSVPAGQAFHVPPHARHALRNTGAATVSTLIISTPDLMRFFEETGEPVTAPDAAPPLTPERLDRLTEAGDRFGHWIAPPEDDAAVGLDLPVPTEPA